MTPRKGPSVVHFLNAVYVYNVHVDDDFDWPSFYNTSNGQSNIMYANHSLFNNN